LENDVLILKYVRSQQKKDSEEDNQENLFGMS